MKHILVQKFLCFAKTFFIVSPVLDSPVVSELEGRPVIQRHNTHMTSCVMSEM